MFEPLVDVGKWFIGLVPTNFRGKKLRFNYLLVHYTYLISMSIVGSVIIYGGGAIPYNDALFFAVGCATQSGLNTINVNDLQLFQQITMMLIACVTNPIFINTVVVFVRLYWFEKRFKHIVEELREKRRARVPTISRTKSEMKADNEKDLEAGHGIHGVNGREIRVLHETTEPNGVTGLTGQHDEAEHFKQKMGLQAHEDSITPSPEGSNSESPGTLDDAIEGEIAKNTGGQGDQDASQTTAVDHHDDSSPTLHHRDIKFADEVEPLENDEVAVETPPEDHDDMFRHIEFLQRQQRNAKEGTTLRIPGPRAFERGELPEELSDSDEENPQRPRRQITLDTQHSESERQGANTSGDDPQNADDHTQRSGIKFEAQDHPGHRPNAPNFEQSQTTASKFSMNNIRNGLRRQRTNLLPNVNEARNTIGHTFSTLSTVLSREREPENAMPYLSWQATTGRNSAFLGLTEAQREELGGIEYRSLKTLAKILLCYFFGFHLSGVFVNLPWILLSPKYRNIVRHDFGQNPTWWAFFTAASEFNDLGLTLTPNSMLTFNTSTLILLYGSLLIIVGNTGFPIGLRFVIWVTSKFTSYGSRLWEELRFLLDHPRRCFVLLFPSKASWWLFWVLVLLNGIDLVFYIILDLHDKEVTSVAPGYRVLDGWYQAVCTRTAGFSVVNLFYLHPAIQVSYLIMMYISVFPIAISVRRTNVYEEKSLGIFGGEEEGGEDEQQSYVGQHLRRQLSFDLWFIFLGLFIIAIVEGDRIQNTNDYAFTMFSVLFEIVSAYGTVGLSLGYPTIDASFSAEFKVISKLVIMAMMLRGRHRGLPYALDRAILLPSDNLQKKEAADADRQLQRRGSIFAEANQDARQGENWHTFELDENGLPKQHLASLTSGNDVRHSSNAARNSVAGEEEPLHHRRRNSGISVHSTTRPRRRSKSLSRVIAGGLSAGPTFSKHD